MRPVPPASRSFPIPSKRGRTHFLRGYGRAVSLECVPAPAGRLLHLQLDFDGNDAQARLARDNGAPQVKLQAEEKGARLRRAGSSTPGACAHGYGCNSLVGGPRVELNVERRRLLRTVDGDVLLLQLLDHHSDKHVRRRLGARTSGRVSLRQTSTAVQPRTARQRELFVAIHGDTQ